MNSLFPEYSCPEIKKLTRPSVFQDDFMLVIARDFEVIDDDDDDVDLDYDDNRCRTYKTFWAVISWRVCHPKLNNKRLIDMRRSCS